jgi:hypothetical protein
MKTIFRPHFEKLRRKWVFAFTFIYHQASGPHFKRQALILHEETTREEFARDLRRLAAAVESGNGLVTGDEMLRGQEINRDETPYGVVRELDEELAAPPERKSLSKIFREAENSVEFWKERAELEQAEREILERENAKLRREAEEK